jgi:hypothetical protein
VLEQRPVEKADVRVFDSYVRGLQHYDSESVYGVIFSDQDIHCVFQISTTTTTTHITTYTHQTKRRDHFSTLFVSWHFSRGEFCFNTVMQQLLLLSAIIFVTTIVQFYYINQSINFFEKSFMPTRLPCNQCAAFTCSRNEMLVNLKTAANHDPN